MTDRKLWYRAAARNWNEALPIGNGRIGAMVFGGALNEKLALNEDSIWYGGPQNRINPDAASQLGVVRDLIFKGRIREAEELAMMSLIGVPEHPAHYVPLGDLHVDFANQRALMGQPFDAASPPKASEYNRDLDIERAIASVSYESLGVRYRREYFVSGRDQMLVFRVTADKPASINCTLRMSRERYAGRTGHTGNDTLFMHAGGGGEGGVTFSSMVRAIPAGGAVEAFGEVLRVRNADSLVVMLSAATSYRYLDAEKSCLDMLNAAAALAYEDLLERHVRDYRSFFDRMDLRIGSGVERSAGERAHGAETAPTDERLAAVVPGSSDTGLAELYFHFGRYLLISSSRPGTLPANLQGIWNDQFLPPWGSKFTVNINTQMNYWPAEACGLGDCHQPLFDLLERMLPNGQRTARDMYGCRGFVAHHNTDLWGDTAPVDRWIPATVWPMSAAWLSLHIWEHWEYSGDPGFLRENLHIMKEAALFMLDFLVPDQRGRLVTNPSMSPENTYVLPGGERGSMCYGPSMDSQILYKLFTVCAEACAITGDDSEFAKTCLITREQLPKPDIGKFGQLMEWPEDYEEAEPGHRHISHLFALYPADQISPVGTPMLAKAARRSLEGRLAMGGGHTGWSRAWIINLWARLHEGEKAWENIQELLHASTLPNLLDNHPPFQIDGNFGATAGMLEMLVQCVRGEIRLLPALSRATAAGSLRGVRLKGGFALDMDWERGKLASAVLRADRDTRCAIRLGAETALLVESDSAVGVQSAEPGLYVFDAKAGGEYRLRLSV